MVHTGVAVGLTGGPKVDWQGDLLAHTDQRSCHPNWLVVGVVIKGDGPDDAAPTRVGRATIRPANVSAYTDRDANNVAAVSSW
jgi:hypothetical protein